MKSISSIIKHLASDLSPKPNILGVNGSPRKGGNCDVLLKSILSGASDDSFLPTALYLRDIQFTGCIGCEKCRKDKICTGLMDGMSLAYSRIISCQGLVLISPTHNYNITSWMKAFIDRLYCFYQFENNRPRSWSSQLAGQNRKAVIAAVCEQENEKDMGFTIQAMRTPIEALGYEIVGELSVFGIFDKGKVREKTSIIEKAKKMGKTLVKAVTGQVK